ncbi:hypothetical protein B0H15DRAFT_945322 [Mycena belliarum]|uniref:Uncharacterized protein n=1 Tax=Mycena belliarum TaxID=1033014 RepID=A0AAD6XZE5_9AGAR|nr:hypothetical protein B0H15DRAFT_945322 [Mycena belliae]
MRFWFSYNGRRYVASLYTAGSDVYILQVQYLGLLYGPIVQYLRQYAAREQQDGTVHASADVL